MKLKKGQKAPNFIVKDSYGNTVQLKSFKGKKLLLSFFRDVTCPFCNLRVRDLVKRREELEKEGLSMIFFFESTNKQLHDSPFHLKASPTPLIGDPDLITYEQFGVEKSTIKVLKTFFQKGTLGAIKETKSYETPNKKEKHVSKNLIPADFLIDENFTIQQAYYGTHLRDHLHTTEIISFAKS